MSNHEEGELAEGLDSVCHNCKAPCPPLLLDARGLCHACQKRKKCKGCKTAQPTEGEWCLPCDKARNSKWVTRETFDDCMDRMREEQAATLQGFLETFGNRFMSQNAHVPTIPVGAAAGSEHVNRTKPTSAAAGADQTQRKKPVSAAAGSAAQLAGLENPDNSEDSENNSEFVFRKGQDDRNDGASLAETTRTARTNRTAVTATSRVSDASEISNVVPLRRKKEGFISDIQHLNDPLKPQTLEQLPTDGMHKLFGNCTAYAKTEEEIRMPLSELQKQFLMDSLQPNKEMGKAVHKTDLKSLPVSHDVEKIFSTPKVNPVIAEYLAILHTKPSDKGKTKSVLPTNSVAKNCEKTLEKVDVAAKAGLRYSVYVQWLLSCIKKTISDTLEEDHALMNPDGTLMKALDEGFNTMFTPMKQFCRVANLSVLERRRIYLDELHLKSFPQSEAGKLPLDIEQGLLFGKEQRSENESVDIESIISKYSEKASEIRKYSTAFTVQLPDNKPAGRGQKRPGTGNAGNNEKKAKSDYKSNDKSYTPRENNKFKKEKNKFFRGSNTNFDKKE